jgi:hypothetical protein
MSARLRIALLAGAGLLLLQVGWILALAPHVGIDEFDHALRANSVAEGHWQPGDDVVPRGLGRGDLIPVRKDVAESVHAGCAYRPYTGPYNCNPVQDLGGDQVLIASAAAKYNPSFYAIVGTLALPFHGNANLYALRVATAALGCLLFMLTVWLAAGRARTRWPVAVLGLAALPTTVYSMSVASPNGIEMICGLGTWVALLAVVETEDRRHRRSAYLLLSLFVAVLVNFHTMGAVWLALMTVAVALLHGPVRTVRSLLPRNRLEGAAVAFALVAASAEILWVATSGANDPGPDLNTASPWGYVLNGFLLWPLQAIGAFPMRNDHAPGAVYALELVVLIVVAAMAARATALRSRVGVTLGFVTVMSFLVPAVLTMMTFASVGDAWQGRYGMPFTAGLLVLAGRQLDAKVTDRSRLRPFAVAAAGALVLAELIGQWHVVATQRVHADLVAGSHWHPPSLLLLSGLAVLAGICWIGALQMRSAPALTLEPAPVAHVDREEVPA